MSVPAGCRVAILTGQSDRSGWALSPEQENFLDALGIRQSTRQPDNFPYLPACPPHRPIPLLPAALNNGLGCLGSYLPSFRRNCSAAVERLILGQERTIFLAGSCGLELFNNLHLPTELLRRVSLFAFGPVARHRPACEHLLVGGSRDWLSRLCFPRPDRLIECGHLGYLANPALRRLCADFIAHAVARGRT